MKPMMFMLAPSALLLALAVAASCAPKKPAKNCRHEFVMNDGRVCKFKTETEYWGPKPVTDITFQGCDDGRIYKNPPYYIPREVCE
jgi:hypothetical protein